MAIKRTGVLDALDAGPKSADALAQELGALHLPVTVHLAPTQCRPRLQTWCFGLYPIQSRWLVC